MTPIKANHPRAVGVTDLTSGRLRINAKAEIRTARVITVKKVAVGADTLWVPTLIRT